MALDFDGSGGWIDWGTEGIPSSGFTYMGWVYPTSTTSEGVICTLSESDGAPLIGDMTDLSQDIGLFSVRSSSNAFYQTNTTPLSPLNNWYFVAVTEDPGAAQNIHIYVGDPSTLAAEQTYGTSNDGAGSYTLSAGNEHRYLGGDHDGLKPFPGRVGPWMVTHSVLSLAEIRRFQVSHNPRADAELYTVPGWPGSGGQLDWSGNARTGSVSGTPSVADGAPVAPGYARRRSLFIPAPSAGGQDIPAAVSEGVGFADTYNAALSFATALTEGLSLNEALSAQLGLQPAVAEGLGLSETVAAQTELMGAVAEGLGLSDTPSARPELVAALSEGLSVDDALSVVLEVAPSLGETLGVGDSVTARLVATMALVEAFSLDDVVTADEGVTSFSISEDWTLADLLSATLEQTGAGAETSGFGDTYEATVAALGALRVTSLPARLTDEQPYRVALDENESIGASVHGDVTFSVHLTGESE